MRTMTAHLPPKSRYSTGDIARLTNREAWFVLYALRKPKSGVSLEKIGAYYTVSAADLRRAIDVVKRHPRKS